MQMSTEKPTTYFGFSEKEVEKMAEWEKDLLAMGDPLSGNTYSGPPQQYMAGFDPNEPVKWGEPTMPSYRNRMGGPPGCTCPMCKPSNSPTAPIAGAPRPGTEESKVCPKCANKDDRIAELIKDQDEATKTISDATATVAELSAKLTEAEEKRDEYDAEADRLASAYEYAVIERDYLLKMNEWANEQLIAAWEKLEELGHVA